MDLIKSLGFAAGASLPLLAGAGVGLVWRPPRGLVAVALAFAAGALISAVSFELFEESYRGGGALRAGLSFAAGALVFVVADALLDRFTAGHPTGLALLAGVTLDGVPENTALGVGGFQRWSQRPTMIGSCDGFTRPEAALTRRVAAHRSTGSLPSPRGEGDEQFAGMPRGWRCLLAPPVRQ
jgi:hypothetical protein